MKTIKKELKEAGFEVGGRRMSNTGEEVVGKREILKDGVSLGFYSALGAYEEFIEKVPIEKEIAQTERK